MAVGLSKCFEVENRVGPNRQSLQIYTFFYLSTLCKDTSLDGLEETLHYPLRRKSDGRHLICLEAPNFP